MKKLFIYSTSALLLFLTACKKYLEEDPVSQLSYQLYETEEGLEGALVSAYNSLRLGVASERMLTFNDAGTDLFTVGSDGNTAFNQYLATLNSLNDKIDDFWDYHYEGISECNVTLKYIPKVTMSDTRKLEIEGEARFLRAYYYFNLVQHFGRIPLVLEAYDQAKTDFTREAVKTVYDTILNDLRIAYQLLPNAATETGRAYKAPVAHLMAKVYLARASAVSAQQQQVRGTQPTDVDSALYYAGKIVNQELGSFSLVNDFADLFDFDNQTNSEVIFAVQFTTTTLDNGSGNQQHLYHVPQYDAINTKILARSIEYGRPYRRVRPTPYVYNGLFGDTRKYDSRFVKSFIWGYIANKAATGITTTAGNTIDVKVGDTAVYFSPVYYDTQAELDIATEENKRFAVYMPLNTYQPFSRNNLFPGSRKWLDPKRSTTNETNGSRDWMVMRYGETLLLLAEAYGRKGDFTNAAKYINMVRERAAYKTDELKTVQYWTFEGGSYTDSTTSTVAEMMITPEQISANFADFILEERGREMLAELNRWEDLARCEKLVERVLEYNPDAGNIRSYHVLRPIPQTHIDRLDPKGSIEEEQNEGYY